MSELPITALLIEDDERLARFTAEFLMNSGVSVCQAANGNDGLATAMRCHYDVVILDLMLPGRDGLDVCKRLRALSNVPILVVTARLEELDRLLAFELGADDYMSKPFSPRELLARMRVHVRRARGQVGPDAQPSSLRVGALELKLMTMSATLNGRQLDLTSCEFLLLKTFAERAGRALTREQILDLATGSSEDSFERSIDVRISRLRQKLGDDPRSPRLLKTVRGMGYMLAVEVAQ